MTRKSQYRIQFIRIETEHNTTHGFDCTGPVIHNRYYCTKRGLLHRLLSLLRDPLVQTIEVTEGDRSRVQPFYCARATTRLESEAAVEGTTRWYIPSWGWGSWAALSRLLEVDEAYWSPFQMVKASP